MIQFIERSQSYLEEYDMWRRQRPPLPRANCTMVWERTEDGYHVALFKNNIMVWQRSFHDPTTTYDATAAARKAGRLYSTDQPVHLGNYPQ